MVMKQGADDAMEARKAFKAVHEDIEDVAFESKVSSRKDETRWEGMKEGWKGKASLLFLIGLNFYTGNK